MELAKALEFLPSRLQSPDVQHPVHQLVIEKFPDNTWGASYVCLSCKGKTAHYKSKHLEDALNSLISWYRDGINMNAFKPMPIIEF